MTNAKVNPRTKQKFFGHGLSLIVAALVPALWIMQLIVNYGLSSYACFPRNVPHEHLPPEWHWLLPVMLAINLIALFVCVCGIFASSSEWRDRRIDYTSSINEVIEIGESPIKYLDLWGYIVATGFLLVILFNTFALLVIPSC